MTDLAQQLVDEEEGCVLTAYRDSLGKFTIGYGHLLQPQSQDWTGYTLTQQEAEAFLGEDMSKARIEATSFPGFYNMNDVRQAVCISMCFQMGDKPLHWPNFMAALRAEDYAAAGVAGRDSDWWREQTRKRAEREMQMLETGVWVNRSTT